MMMMITITSLNTKPPHRSRWKMAHTVFCDAVECGWPTWMMNTWSHSHLIAKIVLNKMTITIYISVKDNSQEKLWTTDYNNIHNFFETSLILLDPRSWNDKFCCVDHSPDGPEAQSDCGLRAGMIKIMCTCWRKQASLYSSAKNNNCV